MAEQISKRGSGISYGEAQGATQQGVPVDKSGSPAVDPTKNVLDLVNAAVKRLDDLQEAQNTRINEIATLRADYTEKLAIAESKRIDAIRAVDVNAVAVAAERAAAQAQVLANQVAASADTLRALVAATAATIAQQLAALTTQLTDRISALEKSQYTSGGISGATTPVIDEKFNTITKTLDMLGTRISSLQDTRSVQQGSDPAIAETLQTILKTQSATATEIESLRTTRSVESGATAKSTSIFTRAETLIPILIAVGLFVLRLMGK